MYNNKINRLFYCLLLMKVMLQLEACHYFSIKVFDSYATIRIYATNRVFTVLKWLRLVPYDRKLIYNWFNLSKPSSPHPWIALKYPQTVEIVLSSFLKLPNLFKVLQYGRAVASGGAGGGSRPPTTDSCPPSTNFWLNIS